VHHETFSEKHERLALNIVTGGMFIIGAATVAESLHRLAVDETSRHDGLGIALAAVSVVALAALSQIKRRVAVKVGSDALRADGWVSAVGALLALVTLAGTGLSAAFGWTWVDPAAATVVGVCAIAVSVKVRLDGR
jgi:divalent metal cation (Fe/Co/Zn/Cd) transporter